MSPAAITDYAPARLWLHYPALGLADAGADQSVGTPDVNQVCAAIVASKRTAIGSAARYIELPPFICLFI